MSPRACPDPTCGIARSLDVLGERWALMIVRDAFLGRSRFSEFRASLGVSPDILTARLTTLVDCGVLARETYRDPGERERDAYVLTDAGRELAPVLAALGRWGADHLPVDSGSRIRYLDSQTGDPVHLTFATSGGASVPASRVTLVRPSP